MYIGYLTSYVGDKVDGLGFCDVSSHFPKHIVRYVLQSHIEIVAHVRVVGYGSRQIFGEMCGVGVVKPQPLDSVYFSKSVDKTSYRRLAVKVASVVCKVLGYEIELLLRERCLPVMIGIAQYEHLRLQPSAIFTYARWLGVVISRSFSSNLLYEHPMSDIICFQSNLP